MEPTRDLVIDNADAASPEPDTDAYEARKLGTLVEVSQALGGHPSLASGLTAVLLTLARRCGAVRGTAGSRDRRAVARPGVGKALRRAMRLASRKRNPRNRRQ